MVAVVAMVAMFGLAGERHPHYFVVIRCRALLSLSYRLSLLCGLLRFCHVSCFLFIRFFLLFLRSFVSYRDIRQLPGPLVVVVVVRCYSSLTPTA